ncbi:MAG: hypothetical protein ACLTTU_13720 [Bilophila wadsworthia]
MELLLAPVGADQILRYLRISRSMRGLSVSVRTSNSSRAASGENSLPVRPPAGQPRTQAVRTSLPVGVPRTALAIVASDMDLGMAAAAFLVGLTAGRRLRRERRVAGQFQRFQQR